MAVRDEVLAAWAEVLDSGRYVLGPQLEAFECEFADYLGVDQVVGVSSGTDALALSLKALGIGPGDEVIVPALTFIGTAEAVCHVGATPVFCDVDPETWVMTPETVRPWLTGATEALIPVHLFGNPAPMRELGSYGLKLIADACQAAGSRYLGSSIGAWGHTAAFSFYPSKNLPGFGDGGAIATNDPDLADDLEQLRHHGEVNGHQGGTHRLDELQAAALRVLLRTLDERVEAQRSQAWRGSQRETFGGYSSYHRVVKLGDRPPRARTFYDPPLHQHPAMRRYWRGELPVAERFAEENWLVHAGPGADLLVSGEPLVAGCHGRIGR